MIRVVHTLGGCGGTLLSRCLGVLPRVALLSEINPLAVNLSPSFNPLYQDGHWLHLLSEEESKRFANVDFGQAQSFCDLMETFHTRSELANLALVLRDYNYVDFVGIPFIDRPPRRRIIYEALPPDVPTRGIAFVRHPIDQWLSLCKHAAVGGVLTPTHFCDAYAAFLEDLGDTPIFKYEDFVRDPEIYLPQICNHLQIAFDPGFKEKFHTFSAVTGDFSRQDDTGISMPVKRSLDHEAIREFQSSPSFLKIVETLGYSTERPGTSSNGIRRRRAEALPADLPDWALDMAWIIEGDERLPFEIDHVNLALNRARLATFLARFADDADVRDLIALDVLGVSAGLPFSSTGAEETTPNLTIRPFRLWEYAWLYKALQLSSGGLDVLDLGGPASHLSILAAVAGCRVISIDINPVFVQAGQDCSRALELPSLDARLGDMRDLSAFPEATFDAVISCSVLEHLTAADQEVSLREVARVLKPGGLVGLTFDYGQGAPGGNEHLPPPHDPPGSSAEAVRRYSQGGLVPAGNPFVEDPVPGSLFHHDSITYTVASLFLGKPPVSNLTAPRSDRNGSRLDRLFIQEMPYRTYKNVSATISSQNNLKARAAAASPMTERASMFEKAAAERLEVIQGLDQAVKELRAEVEVREAALTDLRKRIGALENRGWLGYLTGRRNRSR